MNTTSLASIPVLHWTAHRSLYWSAELPDGSYRINEVSGDGPVHLRIGYELWLHDGSHTTAGQQYLGWHDSVDAAKAAARRHVGDE